MSVGMGGVRRVFEWVDEVICSVFVKVFLLE